MGPLVEAYDELRVRIDRAGAGSYQVFASTRSAEARASFKLPFSELQLENFILRVSRPRGRRRIDSSALGDAKRFGGTLFSALFHEQVYGLYRDALAEARARGHGLRLTFCLSGAPELLDVPWEYLFDPPQFLAISAATPVVRYLDLPRAHRPLAVDPPLRILGVISSPADYERLDVDRERANLTRALASLTEAGAVELRWLEQPTLERLLATLREQTYHALHYVGHGSFDREADRGVLLFEDESGWGQAVTGENLATVLQDFTSLRLVILNACEGARTARSDPFAGVAESLVQREVPAVIAMQFEISDEAAIAFAEGFYTSVAHGFPVDGAVSTARLAMFAKRSGDIEWGTPALFTRVPDGRVFDLPTAGRDADWPATDRSRATAHLTVRRDAPTVNTRVKAKSWKAATGVSSATTRAQGQSAVDADSAPRDPRKLPRHQPAWLWAGLIGVLAILGAAIAILAPSAQNSTANGAAVVRVSQGRRAPQPAGPALSASSSADKLRSPTYRAEVSKTCALDNSQNRAVPASVRTLKRQLATASSWQQEQQLVLQEVSSRITDGDNMLIDVEALQPPAANERVWQVHATSGIKAALSALNTYQLKLERVKTERQLRARAGQFDAKRAQFLADTVATRVALTQIGGPNCLKPTPNLPVVDLVWKNVRHHNSRADNQPYGPPAQSQNPTAVPGPFYPDRGPTHNPLPQAATRPAQQPSPGIPLGYS